MNQVTGKIYQIGDVNFIQSKNGGQPFPKREIVLDTTRFDPYTGERDKFENYPLLEFVGDKCKELDGFNVGDIVTINFDLQGSFYESNGVEKNFTKVRGYKIELRKRLEQSQPAQQTQPAQAPQAAPQQAQQTAQPPYHQPSDFPPPSRQSDLPW